VLRLLKLNEELLLWEHSMAEYWKYSTLPKPTASTEQQEYPQTTLTYPNINSIFLWMGFWMTRLDVLQSLHQLLLNTPGESGIL
jgi:hypothetical protein